MLDGWQLLSHPLLDLWMAVGDESADSDAAGVEVRHRSHQTLWMAVGDESADSDAAGVEVRHRSHQTLLHVGAVRHFVALHTSRVVVKCS